MHFCSSFANNKYIKLYFERITMNSYNMFSNSLKYMLIGMAIGAAATVAIASSPKATNKIKDTTENAKENISSMFKLK